MKYYPLFVDTAGIKVLLIGGGEVAARKLSLLCRTSASIRVIAQSACDDVLAMANEGRIELLARAVTDTDMCDCQLLYLATDDEALNIRLANIARPKGIWVNLVDNPAYCDFITPSIVDRGRLVVAISTAGAAPVFARDIRARLEAWLPPSLAPLFDYIASKRLEVQDRLDSVTERRRFWERFFGLNGDRFDAATAGHFEHAFESTEDNGLLLLLERDTPALMLPIAAMSLLQKLDVIESDMALDGELNELCRRDAGRRGLSDVAALSSALADGQKILVCADSDYIAYLKTQFPLSLLLQPGQCG